MSTKFLLAVLAGSIISFFGGWLIWGMLLHDLMQSGVSEAAQAVQKAEEDMIMWAMIVANIVWGFLITWVISNAKSTNAMSGAITGAILFVLIALAMNLFFYAMLDWFTSLGSMFIDVAANVVYGGIIGAVVGWILGRGGE